MPAVVPGLGSCWAFKKVQEIKHKGTKTPHTAKLASSQGWTSGDLNFFHWPRCNTFLNW